MSSPINRSTATPAVCPHHQQYLQNVFCQTCSTAICFRCKADSHNSHKTMLSSERIRQRPKSAVSTRESHTKWVSRTLSKSTNALDTSIDETIGELIRQNCSEEQLIDVNKAKRRVYEKVNWSQTGCQSFIWSCVNFGTYSKQTKRTKLEEKSH